MTQRLNDLIHETSYRAVQQSPLFDSLETNNAVDAKANELADLVKGVVKSFIEQECGSSPLLAAPALNSLRVESEREERSAA